MALPDLGRLGLTANPFENIEPGSRLDWVEVPPPLAAALAHPPFAVELVGDKGAGKTTILRWYCATHPGAAYVYASSRRLPALPEGPVVCLDEANNLSRAAQAQLVARTFGEGRSLLLSTHVGLDPRLGPLVSFRLEPLSALGWVARRVEAAALPTGPSVDLVALAGAVAARTTGLAYATQRVMYELVESLARGADVQHALEDAWRRAAEDPTVAPALGPRPPAWP